MSVDLKVFENQSFEATITSVRVMPLREWLKTKRNPVSDATIDAKFNNPDRDNVVVVAECGNAAVDAFFVVPTPQGYGKSNLKRFIENNSLPMVELPRQAKQWLGKKVKCRLNKEGYLRFAV